MAPVTDRAETAALLELGALITLAVAEETKEVEKVKEVEGVEEVKGGKTREDVGTGILVGTGLVVDNGKLGGIGAISVGSGTHDAIELASRVNAFCASTVDELRNRRIAVALLIVVCEFAAIFA
ncbi:hypothetical protein BDEG_20076 [Batrachochytrium dendrobatidis JEL423]|uniref:Uncharacterized protein n=1 Tax=Batrachochytrium dendrobatidis (strain JEL423) TaxID=403673 RepID=A0A177W859_BATDL|nr:hypothetical protein BDEG_20076 [Batrachochytrium dendrobatidis JEL423]